MSINKKITNIYIDASNILISLKNKNLILDFDKFFVYLKDKFRADKIYYFTPKWNKELDLYKKISDIKNLEIVYKEIYNENSKLKTNCDVEIAFKIMKDILLDGVDNIILISGDGDFVCLLDYATELNKSVRVIGGTKESTAKIIKKREYLKYYLLTDVKELIINEKPPLET